MSLLAGHFRSESSRTAKTLHSSDTVNSSDTVTHPRPASEILTAVLKEAGSQVERAKFATALRTVLGPEMANHCEILGFRGGRLTVEVDSSPLYAELSAFRTEEIRQAMNEHIDHQRIAQLVLRMGGTGHV